MRIGIDFDDVLVDFVPAFLHYHNRLYGTDTSRDDVWSYHFWEVFDITKDEMLRRIFSFLDSPESESIRPIVGACKGVMAIGEKHELHIITGRQDRIAPMTSRLLLKHFGDAFSGIHFANHFSDNASHLSKGVICDRLGIDVLIDDSPANALESAAPGRKVLLLDAPWNGTIADTDSIRRVRSWKDIISTIGTLSLQHSQV